jgi:hypothetical protein
MKTGKNKGRAKRQHWCHSIGLDFLFQKTTLITRQKNETLSQEMNLKIPLSSRGFELSKFKTSCRLSSLILCEIDKTMPL